MKRRANLNNRLRRTKRKRVRRQHADALHALAGDVRCVRRGGGWHSRYQNENCAACSVARKAAGMVLAVAGAMGLA